MGTTEKVPCSPRTATPEPFFDNSYDADDECLYCDELIFELCNGHERCFGDYDDTTNLR
jgi:hypothetical protein